MKVEIVRSLAEYDLEASEWWRIVYLSEGMKEASEDEVKPAVKWIQRKSGISDAEIEKAKSFI